MSSIVSLVVSAIALGVSILTAWMTLFRRGSVRMTRPAVIFFGMNEREKPKIFLRTLLFATAKRGRVLESLYVTLTPPEGSKRYFNIWVYGDKSLVRGSGLFVGDAGVEANHHFLLSENQSDFQFQSGRNIIEVYAHILGSKRKRLLFSQELLVDENDGPSLMPFGPGLYFDWFPESSQYIPHIVARSADNSD